MAERISTTTALDWLTNMPLSELMARADAVRWEKHPRAEVTYVLDTNPNYTNVCTANCKFCSFYRPVGHPEGYVNPPADVARRVAAAQAQGATTVLLQGGHNPELGLDYYLAIIDAIQAAAPGIHLHLFSPSELDQISRATGLSVHDILTQFWERGCRTMPGGGAEILVERVRRRVSPKKLSAEGWLDIMRTAHKIGFATSATMMYGHLEEDADVIEHLDRLRTLQDETGGFYAFIPWSFKRGDSPLSRLVPTNALPTHYLRILAISRLMLDNISSIQCSWFNEGVRTGQLGLYAGADDFGGILFEENVLYQAQHKVAITQDSLMRAITEAGFTPVQRTTLYEAVERKTPLLPVLDGTIVRTIERTPGAHQHA
jgi:cyclic dehypoxanthinyl futalosine synthase